MNMEKKKRRMRKKSKKEKKKDNERREKTGEREGHILHDRYSTAVRRIMTWKEKKRKGETKRGDRKKGEKIIRSQRRCQHRRRRQRPQHWHRQH
jgi:hypothetical protein